MGLFLGSLICHIDLWVCFYANTFNVRPETIKVVEEHIGSKISDIAHSNILSDISPQARETKEKNKQMGLHQTKMFLQSKGKYQQNKKTTHRMGEHIQ